MVQVLSDTDTTAVAKHAGHEIEKEPVMFLSTVSDLCRQSEASNESLSLEKVDNPSISISHTPSVPCRVKPDALSADVQETASHDKNGSSSKSVKFLSGEPGFTRVEDISSVGITTSLKSAETPPQRECLAVDATDEGVALIGASKYQTDGPCVKRIGRLRSPRISAESASKARKNNNYVFVVLIVLCVVMCFRKYPILFIIFIPLFAWVMYLRVLYPYIHPRVQFRQRLRVAMAGSTSFFKSHRGLFLPPPICTLGRIYLYADHLILKLVVQSVGTIVSMCIIMGLLVVVSTALVLLLIQIQVELSHYVTVGSVVWNKTLQANPQLVL